MSLSYCRCGEKAAKASTFTGSSVAEKASWRAQQARRHISSVKTGPTVTRRYLRGNQQKGKDAELRQRRDEEKTAHESTWKNASSLFLCLF